MKTLFDIFMIFITGGLWLIWMIVRALNKKQNTPTIIINNGDQSGQPRDEHGHFIPQYKAYKK